MNSATARERVLEFVCIFGHDALQPTRTEKFWNHWGRAAVVTSSAVAAWLLSGTAEAEDFYLRAGISLDRPAETQFTDEDCSSVFPAALYGCGTGGDGAPLRSVGNFSTAAGVEFGLGYARCARRESGGSR